jgi:hypothetical protein
MIIGILLGLILGVPLGYVLYGVITVNNEDEEDGRRMDWISIEEKLPESFVSVLGYMTDADQFPAVRECYMVNNGNFYFPALNEFHPVSHWMQMPESSKGE